MADVKDKTPLEYWLALSSVEGLGSVRINRLIARFGSVKAIFEAELPEIARLPSFNPVLATRILTVSGNFATFRERLDALNNQDIRVLCPEDPDYPAQLKPLPDAPGILCHVGELKEINTTCIAIVGTKQPSPEAIQLTLTLTTALVSAGFIIVSGLASGIDAAAHSGALAAMGKTIGVVGTDLSSIYPAQHNPSPCKSMRTGVSSQSIPSARPPHPATSSNATVLLADSQRQQS